MGTNMNANTNQNTTVTIYHNPACGTSRNTLALIRNAGIEPVIVDYLKTPPTLEALREMINKAGLSVRDVIRQKEAAFTESGLGDMGLSDEALLTAMVVTPILINRPLVVSEIGVRLCRPSEVVLDILPLPQKAAFSKEDGEVVIDANGKRVASHT